MKIIHYTTTTIISTTTYIKPVSPVWMLFNTGTSYCFCNGLRIAPGEKFGIDATNLFALADDVQNDTEFYIKFQNTVPDVSVFIPASYIDSCLLVETVFKRKQ